MTTMGEYMAIANRVERAGYCGDEAQDAIIRLLGAREDGEDWEGIDRIIAMWLREDAKAT